VPRPLAMAARHRELFLRPSLDKCVAEKFVLAGRAPKPAGEAPALPRASNGIAILSSDTLHQRLAPAVSVPLRPLAATGITGPGYTQFPGRVVATLLPESP
jgi:hypothetical protein